MGESCSLLMTEVTNAYKSDRKRKRKRWPKKLASLGERYENVCQ